MLAVSWGLLDFLGILEGQLWRVRVVVTLDKKILEGARPISPRANRKNVAYLRRLNGFRVLIDEEISEIEVSRVCALRGIFINARRSFEWKYFIYRLRCYFFPNPSQEQGGQGESFLRFPMRFPVPGPVLKTPSPKHQYGGTIK